MNEIVTFLLAIILLVLLGIGVLLIKMIVEARSFHVTEEEVFLERLPEAFEGTRLFFISDLHRRVLTPAHLQQIQEHNPASLYLIGGDLTEKGGNLQKAIGNVKAIRGMGPTFVVHGNHDYKADVRTLDIGMMELGVKILDNEAIRCEQDGSVLWLVGIDDIRSKRANIEAAMEEPNLDPHFTIMLAHDPLLLKRGAPPLVDLILSGHTHGGQINLLGYGPLRTSTYYRQFTHGWHHIGRTNGADDVKAQMFISRGFGTTHLPFRLGAKPEASFITLRCLKR